MLKVNCARWVQSKELLREEALKAGHPRTRERLMALYEISEGKNATQVAIETKRNPETVMKWVHRYNQEGLGALKYQRTGGRKPVLPPIVESKLGKQIRDARFIGSSSTTGEKRETNTALDIKKICSMAQKSMED